MALKIELVVHNYMYYVLCNSYERLYNYTCTYICYYCTCTYVVYTQPETAQPILCSELRVTGSNSHQGLLFPSILLVFRNYS